MASLVERLKSKDPDLVELRLTEIPQAYCAKLEELIAALAGNDVVTYIRIDRDFLPGIEHDDEVDDFFKAIGRLPKLTDALIWHASVAVKALADFVKEARGLENLQLGCLDLVGTVEDFASIAGTLEGHPNLKLFTLTDFSLNDESVSIDGLVETLSRLPALETVKIEVTNTRRVSITGADKAGQKCKVSISGTALATLCGSPTLKELVLGRLQFTSADFEVLSASIATAPGLKSLAMPHCGLDDTACSNLSVAFGKSSTIEKVDLSCNNLTDEGCIAIATALKENSSVKFLRLWGNVKISNAGFDALVDMLETNCVLERVPLMAPLDYKNKIDAKLVQNRGMGNRAA